MAQHDGSLILKTFVDQSGINKGIQSIKGSLSSLAGALGVAFSTVALVNFGKEAVQLASDIQEVQNVVDVTFGKSAKTINSFSKTAIKQFGLSELAAKRYASTMGAMLKSSGLADEAVLNMSQSLTGLAGDLASFYNLSSDEAFNKLRAGISGESEPLNQLGINLSVTNLEAVALSKGITKSYESMSEAEKVMVRYYAILDKTNDAQGDYARTADSFANKMRNLSMKWEGFQQVMGQTIMIFAEAILPALETAIDKLTEIAYYLYAFTRAMSGVTEREGTIFSQQIQDTSNAADSAAQVLPEAAEGIEQTGEAAKKATKQLAAFDDLMILTASGNSDIFDGDFGNIDSINNQIAGIDSLLDSETMKSIEEFERWVSDNKDGIQEALDTGAMIALGAAIGGVAGKIVNSLLPSFGKKDTGLDKQTKKTWKEWAAQSALSGVFALTGAAAGLLTGKLIGNTDAEKENFSRIFAYRASSPCKNQYFPGCIPRSFRSSLCHP